MPSSCSWPSRSQVRRLMNSSGRDRRKALHGEHATMDAAVGQDDFERLSGPHCNRVASAASQRGPTSATSSLGPTGDSCGPPFSSSPTPFKAASNNPAAFASLYSVTIFGYRATICVISNSISEGVSRMHQAHQHQLPPASSSTVPPQKRSFISSAVLALSAVLGCSLLTLLPPFHAAQTIFATAFIPAVLVSAWYGGIGLGLLATALSSAFMVYFVLEPVHSFAIRASEDLARIVAFAVVGVSVSFVVAFQRRIRDASLENAERLRTTLERLVTR